MTGSVRKAAAEPQPEGPWVSLNKASRLLGETREAITKRCLRGEIRTMTPAHLVLLFEEDVLRLAEAKRAAEVSG